MLWRKIILIVSLSMPIFTSFAQNSIKLMKQASAEYEALSYRNAIRLYEEAIHKNKDLSENDLRFLRIRLAYSYRQVKDFQNAERVYRDLFNSSPKLDANELKNYLYFAQTLASNGKHDEAKLNYQKYDELQQKDKNAQAFSKLYDGRLEVLSRNAVSYKVDYLGINSGNAEFSPMYYKNGLIFVSAKASVNGIKHVFDWDSSPFLDLYYLENIKQLKLDRASSIGSSSKSMANASVPTNKLIDDYSVPSTANDSQTLGYASSKTSDPTKEEVAAISTQKFSRTLNSKYHEGPATFYHDGTKIIFTRNNSTQTQDKKYRESITKLKLYMADLVDNDWQKVRELPFNSDNYSTGHPALAPDDKTLYFVSNMPGGFGGTDIYMSRYENGQWSKPQNLGNQVNTSGNEMFPFVDEQGNLYFSTDGLPGLGDLDIYYAPLDKTTGIPSKKPRNVGVPINSNRDDFGIITDGERKKGFFSSNRKRGGSDDDIYAFERIGPLYGCRDLVVKTADRDTKTPLNNVRIDYALKNNPNTKKSSIANHNGIANLCLDADSDYVITVSQNGYSTSKVEYSNRDASDFEPSKLDILLIKLKNNSSNSFDNQLITNSKTNASIFKGVVTAGQDNTAIAGVLVKFTNKCDGKTQEVITEADGSYEFKRDLHCDYILEAIKANFGKSSEFVSKVSEKRKIPAKKISTANNSLFDTKLYKVGDVVQLDNIYYDSDSYELRKDARRELQKLVATMQKYPNMIIEIHSHTDSRGNAAQNLALSQKRADYVVDFLAENGIDRERMVAIGKGETEPVNECGDGIQCTESEYQRNRRTEFKILQIEKLP